MPRKLPKQRNALAWAVKFRTGAGPHRDRRERRVNRRSWRKEWLTT